MLTVDKRTVFSAGIYEDVVLGEGVILEPYSVIYDNCSIGDGSLIGACTVLMPKSRVGKYSLIGQHGCMQGNCRVGDYTTVHWNCEVTAQLLIGDNCFIGPRFRSSNTREITKGRHGTKTEFKPELTSQVIEDNVRIGADVSFIPGITVGHDSIIYQCCLITKNIPPHSIVKGGKDFVGRIIGRAE